MPGPNSDTYLLNGNVTPFNVLVVTVLVLRPPLSKL